MKQNKSIKLRNIPDNNISILFSTFNILKSNKMKEEDSNSEFQNKSANDQQNKDSMFSHGINNSQIENEKKR